jgi:hypothetical protein
MRFAETHTGRLGLEVDHPGILSGGVVELNVL